MSYNILNFDHLLNHSDVKIAVNTERDKSGSRFVLKLVLHSKANKVILTLSEEQVERIIDALDDAMADIGVAEYPDDRIKVEEEPSV